MKDLRKLLKPGRIIEFENGRRAFIFVWDNHKWIMYNDGYDDINNISSDLVFEGAEDNLKIMRIYKGGNFGKGLNFALANLDSDVIWHRTIELTIEEISEKFNIPVECLKIKK